MYKFNEREIVEELMKYIDETYNQHYATGKIQTTEFVVDNGHGTGFCIGNVLKYAQRYGKKGAPEDWRKDLFKVLHYAVIQVFNHDSNYRTCKQEALQYDGTFSFRAPDTYTELSYRSIDDATPEEWNVVATSFLGEKS